MSCIVIMFQIHVLTVALKTFIHFYLVFSIIFVAYLYPLHNLCYYDSWISKICYINSPGRHSDLSRFSVPTLNVVKVNLVRLIGISIVKNSKDIFPGTVDSFAEEEVCKEEFVWRKVQLVISILEICSTLDVSQVQRKYSLSVLHQLRCWILAQQFSPVQSPSVLRTSHRKSSKPPCWWSPTPPWPRSHWTTPWADTAPRWGSRPCQRI